MRSEKALFGYFPMHGPLSIVTLSMSVWAPVSSLDAPRRCLTPGGKESDRKVVALLATPSRRTER
jgi:hypothetical protein